MNLCCKGILQIGGDWTSGYTIGQLEMEDFGCRFGDVGGGLIPTWVSGSCSALWGGCLRDNMIITAPGLETSFLADHGKPSVKIKNVVSLKTKGLY